MTLAARFMAIAVLVFVIPLFWYQTLEPQTLTGPISFALPEIAGFGDNTSHVVTVNDPKLRREISPGDTIDIPPMSRTGMRIMLGILQAPTTIRVHHDGTIRSVTLYPTPVSTPADTSVLDAVRLMIGETGSCNDYPSPISPNSQTAYIQSIESEWDNNTYPALHAVMYFDAPGQYKFPNGSPRDWSLLINPTEGGSNAFRTLAQDPNFTNMITPGNP